MENISDMIIKQYLEQCREKNIGDVGVSDLKDISSVVIDKNKPLYERALSFIAQIKNPYLFKVNNTPVKVSFTDNAPTMQKCLELVFTRNL